PPHHAFATRRSVSLADSASEPFIGLTREEYPDYHSFLSVIFGPVKTKPHLIEEHDSISGVMSSVEAGIGIAIGAEAFGSAAWRLPRFDVASIVFRWSPPLSHAGYFPVSVSVPWIEWAGSSGVSINSILFARP